MENLANIELANDVAAIWFTVFFIAILIGRMVETARRCRK